MMNYVIDERMDLHPTRTTIAVNTLVLYNRAVNNSVGCQISPIGKGANALGWVLFSGHEYTLRKQVRHLMLAGRHPTTLSRTIFSQLKVEVEQDNEFQEEEGKSTESGPSTYIMQVLRGMLG